MTDLWGYGCLLRSLSRVPQLSSRLTLTVHSLGQERFQSQPDHVHSSGDTNSHGMGDRPLRLTQQSLSWGGLL
jgi:hypothetical protein